MKILLALVFAFFAVTSYAKISVPFSNVFDNGGTVVKKDVEKIKVKNGETSTIARGSIVVFSVSADDGATIASGSTSGAPAACVMAESCSASAYCECQTYGYFDALLFDAKYGGAVANEAVFVSTASYYTASNDDVPARAIPVAIVLDTIAATGSVEAFIKL